MDPKTVFNATDIFSDGSSRHSAGRPSGLPEALPLGIDLNAEESPHPTHSTTIGFIVGVIVGILIVGITVISMNVIYKKETKPNDSQVFEFEHSSFCTHATPPGFTNAVVLIIVVLVLLIVVLISTQTKFNVSKVVELILPRPKVQREEYICLDQNDDTPATINYQAKPLLNHKGNSFSCSEPYLHNSIILKSDSNYNSANSVSIIENSHNPFHVAMSKKSKQLQDYNEKFQQRKHIYPNTPKTILNTSWQFNARIGLLGGTLKDDFSDVSLNFPEGSIKSHTGMLLYGSVMTDIVSLRSKFRLDNDTMIVAPVPEYCMIEKETLNKYAVIKIPHCLALQSNVINVTWFQNDPSLPSGFVLKTVERRDPMEKIDESLDIFFVDDNDGFLRIFTKHFSGILCTACRSEIHFDIIGNLYSQFGSYSSLPSLRVKLIIGGPLMKLRAFWAETDKSMQNLGFYKSEQAKIDLLREQDQESSLQFRLELCGDSFARWDHIHRPGSNEPIHHQIQTAQISEILNCGSEHEVNCNIQWYLVNREQEGKTVTLFVDIINILNQHTSEGAPVRRRTTINAEIDSQRICQAAEHTPSGERKDPSKMADAFYLLLDELSTEKLKKLVRYLGFSEKARNMNGSTEEERKDYWYESLEDISATIGADFPMILCQTLDRIEERVARDVREILFANENTGNSVGLASAELLTYESLIRETSSESVQEQSSPIWTPFADTEPKFL